MIKNQESLVLPVHYFDGVKDLKSVVSSMDNELKELISDIHIMFAMKKRGSIGNCVVVESQRRQR